MADQPAQTLQAVVFNDGTGRVQLTTYVGGIGGMLANSITIAAADAATLSAGLTAAAGTSTIIQSAEQGDPLGVSNSQ